MISTFRVSLSRSFLLAFAISLLVPIGGTVSTGAPIQGDQAISIGASGLPLPRWATISTSRLNLRTGPGDRYPIEWVYQRDGMPIEITAEYQDWLKIRDIDGTEGWVFARYVRDSRSAMIVDRTRTLFQEAAADARPLFRAEAGVHGKLLICEEAWCQMLIDGKRGWILREHIYGAYAG
ncbi:MAG: SH3 domain-containing protein, partial [Pseudomonadota bacterium]